MQMDYMPVAYAPRLPGSPTRRCSQKSPSPTLGECSSDPSPKGGGGYAAPCERMRTSIQKAPRRDRHLAEPWPVVGVDEEADHGAWCSRAGGGKGHGDPDRGRQSAS